MAREDLNLKESYKENTQRRDYTPLQVQQSSPETKVAKMASIGPALLVINVQNAINQTHPFTKTRYLVNI